MKHAVIIEIAFAVILALTGAVVMAPPPPPPPPPVQTTICPDQSCRSDDPLRIDAPGLNMQQESDNGQTRPF